MKTKQVEETHSITLPCSTELLSH